MSKIVSKANTPQFNANYDGIFNPPKFHASNMKQRTKGEILSIYGDPTQKDRLARLNQSVLIMQRHKHRNNRF